MKPPPFRYVAPDTLQEALTLLAQHGTEAKLLAGGQSLVPMMNLRLARPAVLIDVNRIVGHDAIHDAGRRVTIPFLARHQTVETSPEIARRVPLLAEAISYVGHPAIRSRGTIAGSVAHADPAAEIPAVLVALDAEIVLRSKGKKRTVAAQDFFVDVFTTALEPTEIVAEIHVPRAAVSGAAFVEIARRFGDFALVGAAAALGTNADGSIATARVALCGVAGKPVRARDAERLLVGHQASARLFTDAGRASAAPLDPPSDIHASATYRKRIAAVLVERALALAARRAGLDVGAA